MFTEDHTRRFYDAEDAHYRGFWDEEGSLHFGYFEDLSSKEFVGACRRWSQEMAARARISGDSRVIDIGCGNGFDSIALAEATGCEVTGIDLSPVRVENARQRARRHPRARVRFRCASATTLPVPDGMFTHAWSQAALYHVHEREKALREIHRVLAEGGIFAFDDLVSPRPDISPLGRQVVYDRLLFEPTFSQDAYADTLRALGFVLYAAVDLSAHLHRSYELLIDRAGEPFPSLAAAYRKMCQAIERRDVGWSFFLCEKVSDKLSWIYSTDHRRPLRERYDAWSHTYDAELDTPYRGCPELAAELMVKHLPGDGAEILDVGAGTGMAGEALHRHGHRRVVGADISRGMLAVASEKGIYEDLVEWDIDRDEAPWGPQRFDGIISTGVFTHGHVPAARLPKVVSLLKPGGVLSITFREEVLAAEGDGSSPQQILTSLPLTLLEEVPFTIFEDEEMRALIFRKADEERAGLQR